MGGSQQHVAAASLGLAVALCIPLVLVVRYRKSRVYRIAPRALNKPVMERAPLATTTAAAVRRAPEEDEQVFSLYGRGDGDSSVDAEPLAPPIELSGSVLALLDSFDVDPVRGESDVLRILTVVQLLRTDRLWAAGTLNRLPATQQKHTKVIKALYGSVLSQVLCVGVCL